MARAWCCRATRSTSARPAVVHGEFDLIIGSDVLYERDERGQLADFIARLAAPVAEVWIVDPNRGNRSRFHRNMARHGFRMEETHLDHDERDGVAAYRGRMLTYRRRSQERALAACSEGRLARQRSPP